MSRKYRSGSTKPSLVSHLLARAPKPRQDTAVPFVSVVTPTWNRRDFLPFLFYIYQTQDHPWDRRELIILDDSAESSESTIKNLIARSPVKENVRYYHSTTRMTLGQKRNKLNALARGEYIVCMDDDDFYPPERISHAVAELRAHDASFAGCDSIHVWYSHLDAVFTTTPFGKAHALNGTFAYHRRYLKTHRYRDATTLAEEQDFLNNFTVPVVQLDPRKTILCVSHNANTFDKDFVMDSCTRAPDVLDDFVGEGVLRQHYHRISKAPAATAVCWRMFDKIVIVPQSGCRDTTQCFTQTLIEMGVAPVQCVTYLGAPICGGAYEDALAGQVHLDVAVMAREQGWRNYLLLDDRLNFVRQEKTALNVNRFLSGLTVIDWQVALLGAELRRIALLQSTPGVALVREATQAVAYAVNGLYYDTLIQNFEMCIEKQREQRFDTSHDIDIHWQTLIHAGRWLSIYPSFAYLGRDAMGQDQTARFFRKLRH